MITDNNSNLNFTARIDAKHFISSHNKRIPDIATLFEAKTKKYPDDVFELVGTDNSGLLIRHYGKGNEHVCEIEPKELNRLFKRSDEYIARKLTKVFRIFDKTNIEIESAKKYVNGVLKRAKGEDPINFEEKFWDLFVKKERQDIELAIQKDPALKKWALC